MRYSQFLLYNVVGAVAWVLTCVLSGYFLKRNGLLVVKENFEVVMVAIVIISVLPMAIEFVLNWRRRRNAGAPVDTAEKTAVNKRAA